MIGQVVEVSGDALSLNNERGFMIVKSKGDLIARIDLDNLMSILIVSRGATLTSGLISECADRNISLITTRSNYTPIALLLPVQQMLAQGERQELQFQMRTKTKAQLWRSIVIGKISTQSKLLSFIASPEALYLKRLSAQVQPGDSDNREAVAALAYWRELFGPEYLRKDEQNPINGMLNYGYAILRSGMLRALLGYGLSPTASLHHSNKRNPMALVDDLMEPYRPLVDQIVWKLNSLGITEINAQVKKTLSKLLVSDQVKASQSTPLFSHMSSLCGDILKIMYGDKVVLESPNIFTPLELEEFVHC